MFVLVTTDEAEHKRVIDFFGIKEEVLLISWPVFKCIGPSESPWKLMIIINAITTFMDDPQELPTMRVTASEEDMVKFKPDDASLTEANMRAVLKQFKV